MTNELPKLELSQVLQRDAADIVAAREKALLIHHTRNIDAAGDEVEKAVRRVIRRKLPTSYYVGHGHVVDSNLSTSSQLDVIIADNTGAPILFATEDGTEYFPYESIYAVGEVKSGYYPSKKDIYSFVDNVARLKSELQRKQAAPSYLGHGISLTPPLTTSIAEPYRNPLFTFMLFVKSDNFKVSDIYDLYSSKPTSELPNILCFLDQGVVVNVRDSSLRQEESTSINIIPEFNKQLEETADHWVFIPFGTDENRIGANFGYLYFMMLTHLKSCILMPPDMLSYLNHVFTHEERIIIV